MCSSGQGAAGGASVEIVEDGPRVRIVRYTLAPGARRLDRLAYARPRLRHRAL
jgi:hypothetical protein